MQESEHTMVDFANSVDEKSKTKDANRDPLSGTPGAHPVGTGIGAAGGAGAGAAIGAMAGPIGAGVGAAIGGIVGGLAGKGGGEAVNPTDPTLKAMDEATDEHGIRTDEYNDDEAVVAETEVAEDDVPHRV
jgi:phage tail tape-measure protein